MGVFLILGGRLSLKDREIVSKEELYLFEVLRHPVFCGEFLENLDLEEYEEPIEYADYQKEFVCDFGSYVSMTAGRAVGKTFSLVKLFIWLLINKVFPGDYIVYTVPNKVHLEPVWDGLIRMFRSNSLLQNFVAPTKGINSSNYTIKLLNNTTLMCRIAGTQGTGANVVGLHTPFIVVDEAAFYPWKTWIELQPTLNTFTNGFRLIVSGVPTGLREKNVLYHVDKENSLYSKHHVTALQNPRYSDDDYKRDIEQYGGEDSDDFQRNVLGKHGKPTFAVFDRSLFRVDTYPVHKLTIDGIKFGKEIDEYIKKLSGLTPLEQGYNTVIMGADLGYTDPTAILIMYRNKMGNFKFHARIQLNKVPYPIQVKVIDFLDTKFNPEFIGVDEGHAGISHIQHMMMDDRLQHKNYSERIIPISFQSNVELGRDIEGNEVKSKMRDFSISLLQEFCNGGRIVFSSTDLEMMSELERMTYMRTSTGNILYRTLSPGGGKSGDDHFTSALLCGVMAYYLNKEMLELNPRKKKLFQATWV